MARSVKAGGSKAGAAVAGSVASPPPARASLRGGSRARSRGATPAAGRGDDALHRRLHFAELLLDISRRVAGIGALDEVLAALVEVTTRELDAERGTLFLSDPATGELYSRVAQGSHQREILLLSTSGIAGHVFTTGEAQIVHDAYADPRFNPTNDEQTGFKTRNLMCVPVATGRGEIIGVSQVLNKRRGRFTKADLDLLQEMTGHSAMALQSVQMVERMQRLRAQELEFLDVVGQVTSEIDIRVMLRKVMAEATRMLNAERSTLFLHDARKAELWSEVGQGLQSMQIRLPDSAGIAGAAFTSGRTINIPHAYADLRFNPSFDRKTGFFTRSILCVPVVNPAGRVIGVTQVLNKRGGPFTAEDESRLKAFTAQIAISLENAKLFTDVQSMKNYNESMLQSMSSGVLTLDAERLIVTCNQAGARILQRREADVLGRSVAQVFEGSNAWIAERIDRVDASGQADILVDAELAVEGQTVAVNLTVLPLLDGEGKRLGSMLMFEDISGEKRLKSTMARYMDPSIADQLLSKGAELLGGRSVEATLLFSDIRGFTTLTEELGAQATVSLLNEYFEIMVDCIQVEGGMLDKFIGDAIMAAFGIQVAHEDDEDRAVRTAVAMIRRLQAWNAVRAEHGRRPVHIGIGINTDTVVSGNIGSNKRMDFTVIGDGVNLAARLESACKHYSAQILVSEFTVRRLRGTYRLREIDRVVVKGKTHPVAVYEVLDHHDESTFPHLMDVVNQFNDGMAKYRAGRFDAAREAFALALQRNPGDRLSQMYVERCEHLIAQPPAAWDGVWVMDEK